MNIRDLRTVLDQLRRLYEAGGAKSAEKDLKAASSALEPHETKSIKEFVSDAEQKLAGKGPSPRRPPAKVDADQYLRQLLDAGTDKSAFYAVFEEVKNDGRIRLAEADAIARQYTGYKAKYKKKHAA